MLDKKDRRSECPAKCPRLKEEIVSPCLCGCGPTPAKIMLCGEAPGEKEDEQGIPFVGRSGDLLNELLAEVGIKREDIYVTNAVRCATADENIKPKKTDIKCCRKYLESEIEKVQPNVIGALGASALESILKRTGITKLKNNIFYSEEFNVKVIPVFHPSHILRNIGFLSNLREGLKLIAKESEDPEILRKPAFKEYRTVADTPEKLDKVFTKLESVDKFVIDLETTSLNYLAARIICVAISWRSGIGVLIPWDLIEKTSLDRFKRLMVSDKVKINHNIKYDLQVLRANKIPSKGPFFDTLPAMALINENIRDKGLDDLTLHYLDMGEYWAELEKWKKNYAKEKGVKVGTITYDLIPKKILYPYACNDADATHRLFDIFSKELKRQGLVDFYKKYTIPTMKMLMELEYRGIKVDRARLMGLIAEYKQKLILEEKSLLEDKSVMEYETVRKKKAIKKLADKRKGSKTLSTRYATDEVYLEKMLKETDWKFNVRSPKQLGELFFKHLKLKPVKFSERTKAPSTDEEVLGVLAIRDNLSIAKNLLKCRQLGKYISTYLVSTYMKSEYDGRIHPNYLQHHAVSGRLSCVEPNMQNIPRDAEDFKECFLADPGFTFVKADLAQAEFRCWAHYSNDLEMIADIESGLDIHRKIAAQVFGKSEAEITKEERSTAKGIVFGNMFGRGAASVAKEFGISLELAEDIKNLFFAMYPTAARWLKKIVDEARTFGCVKTWLGRIRRLPDIDNDYQEVRAEAERQAKNCIDFKTEVLTKRGWVSGWKLSMEDYILTKNAESSLLEWQKPIAINRYGHYHGPIYHINSKSFSAATTPEHRWLVFDKHTQKDICKTSKNISKYGDHRIHRTGTYISNSSEYSDNLVSLIGWILTDGSFLTSKYTGDAINIAQSYRANPKKVIRIEELFAKLKIKYSRNDDKKNCCAHFRFWGPEASFIRSIIPNKKLNTNFLLALSNKQLNLLFESMIAGDGHTDKFNKTSFYTAEEKEADLFQFLCVLLGKASSKRFEDLTERVKVNALKCKKMHNIPNKSHRWTINVLHRDKIQVLPGQYKVLKELRGVWCPTVPNSYFVARRKGFVYITGNSPIQGMATDMNNHYMVTDLKLAKKESIKCYPAATIHDANVIQVLDSQVNDMVKIMNHVVATEFPGFRCKMRLDFEVGKTLGNMVEFKEIING